MSSFAAVHNVMDYGAIADGRTKDTVAVQAAIDAATKDGGGFVLIPAGKTVVVGTIYLKDYVTLHVENGATLLGSPDIGDYAEDTHKNMYKNEPHMDRCLIFARGAKSFAITGKGVIDGNGHPKNFTNKTGRPMLIRFMECRDITVRNITIQNPAAWASAWLYCDEIVVEGIRIHSRVNHNGDGLDFDGCTNVRVSNSSFDTSDDSICLQASRKDRPCKKIVITNCTFESKWAGMRIGLLSIGDFENVTVSNCTFTNIQDSGLKIQMNEGGSMRNMVFSNLSMKNVPRPIFMTLCQQRACDDAPEEMYPMGEIRDVSFNNIVADNRELDKNSAFFLTGMPDGMIKNVSISQVHFAVSGGGTKADAEREIKEYTLETLEGWWPEFYRVGTLPAYGLYARHMDGLSIDNFHVETSSTDERPPFGFDNVAITSLTNVFANGKPIKN
ncbi:glycoside hydrolase family 28 protein [Pelagicoccus mobilis]|uniref:Right-handed parallel beta-helix repeat-containing protein n=1 Tax=Pelagicoccus mobilis TaxID=415221 RepID=A0A934RVP8_9BACT|nr:glycosyl hydrolase family 28 protein [Pelagicoccus mobilis]MBK1875292.1 right-handed parallel beta-helix repeat-containing protein [Pelagicoccus mobilis]